MKLLKELEQFAQKAYIPIMREDTRAVMERLLARLQPKRILEVGTAIGYSAIVMLSVCKNATLVGIEHLHCRHAQALENLKKAGLSDRAQIARADVTEFLSTCEDRFDFVFLDGPKGQYAKLLALLAPRLNERAVILADNLAFDGRVEAVRRDGIAAIPRKHRAAVKGLIEYVDTVQKPPYYTQFYEVGDGIAITATTPDLLTENL